MNTMGFEELRLINPCHYLGDEALMFAHGSHQILENAKVFQSFGEAIKDLDWIIGTTAKKRTSKEEYIDGRDLKGILLEKGNTVNRVGLVFGREESGLTNEEIGQCDLASYLMMNNPYPSLNLSQAVMIYAFLLSDTTFKPVAQQVGKINQEGLKQLKEKVVNLLVDIEINRNPVLFNRILERVMLLGEDDIHLLHSVMNKWEEKSGKE
jgi:tRNA/rRNA methyltransferase